MRVRDDRSGHPVRTGRRERIERKQAGRMSNREQV